MTATLNDLAAAYLAPAQPTFADLYADCGMPCCICLKPLDPAESDKTGLAHLDCARSELTSLYGQDERELWDDYARDMPLPRGWTPEEIAEYELAHGGEQDF